ncbi:MAG: hypothetical protein KatS3mg019_0120 [Fimbriimonadales bacterium]|nr:MAG: hypothetical protein KatS3mg019_0120 [Fimbriimonadales bacterium]
MYRRLGLSLLELLIVLVIVGLLASLTLAVVAESRKRSYKTVCINNLRQLVASVIMYREDYGDLPPAQVLAVPYVKETKLYACPADPFVKTGGVGYQGRFYAELYGYSHIATSYDYIREMTYTRPATYRRLIHADPNYGVFVCPLHDRCDWRGASPPSVAGAVHCLDHVLRGRIDGSVQWVAVPMRWFICRDDGAWTGARDPWRLFTDVPCPPDVCKDTDC